MKPKFKRFGISAAVIFAAMLLSVSSAAENEQDVLSEDTGVVSESEEDKLLTEDKLLPEENAPATEELSLFESAETASEETDTAPDAENPDFTIDAKGNLTKYTGAGGDVYIPSTVTAINSNVFKNNTAITSVSIPGSVVTIGASAFQGCSKLTTVTLEAGTETIGNWAFGYCSALTGIKLPDTVKTIGNHAFSACYALQTADLGNGLLTIGEYAFGTISGYDSDKNTASAITSITIPSSVTTIGNRAFFRCYKLTSADIQCATAFSKGEEFRNCTALADVKLAQGTSAIGNYTFASCALKTITIPSSVTSIGEWAFSYNTVMTEITIPGTVQTIGAHAFSNSYSLTTVELENGGGQLVFSKNKLILG